MKGDPNDPLWAFLIALPFPNATLRIQTFRNDEMQAELGTQEKWWVRLAEKGKEEDPKALIIGPYESKDRARTRAFELNYALRARMVSINGTPVLPETGGVQ